MEVGENLKASVAIPPQLKKINAFHFYIKYDYLLFYTDVQFGSVTLRENIDLGYMRTELRLIFLLKKELIKKLKKNRAQEFRRVFFIFIVVKLRMKCEVM
jgi:hypothetical protein